MSCRISSVCPPSQAIRNRFGQSPLSGGKEFADAGKPYSQIATQNPKELFIRRRRQAQPSKDKAETYTS
jgi:hypothetical protein